MSGPTTQFDADECQALLDLIDRLRFAICPNVDVTEEEAAALAKLETAGKFYIKEVPR